MDVEIIHLKENLYIYDLLKFGRWLSISRAESSKYFSLISTHAGTPS